MSYHYSNPNRENDPHALPNVEVFTGYSLICGAAGCGAESVTSPDYYGTLQDTCPECGEPYGAAVANARRINEGPHWFYAFGFPGCLWDSDPVGPFGSESAALADAMEG
jgi:hypothetical protein